MQPNDYIESRIQDQINWYNKKSAFYKQRYQSFQMAAIVCSICVPLLIGFSDQVPFLKYVAGGLGALVAIIEGAQSLYRYKENWLAYRTTTEALIREQLLFETQAGVYADQNLAFKCLVENTENILSTENRVWLVGTQGNKEKKGNG